MDGGALRVQIHSLSVTERRAAARHAQEPYMLVSLAVVY